MTPYDFGSLYVSDSMNSATDEAYLYRSPDDSFTTLPYDVADSRTPAHICIHTHANPHNTKFNIINSYLTTCFDEESSLMNDYIQPSDTYMPMREMPNSIYDYQCSSRRDSLQKEAELENTKYFVYSDSELWDTGTYFSSGITSEKESFEFQVTPQYTPTASIHGSESYVSECACEGVCLCVDPFTHTQPHIPSHTQSHIHTNTQPHTHTHVHKSTKIPLVRKHIQPRTYTHAHTYAPIHAHANLHTRTYRQRIPVHVNPSVCACRHTHTYPQPHTHTHIQPHMRTQMHLPRMNQSGNTYMHTNSHTHRHTQPLKLPSIQKKAQTRSQTVTQTPTHTETHSDTHTGTHTDTHPHIQVTKPTHKLRSLDSIKKDISSSSGERYKRIVSKAVEFKKMHLRRQRASHNVGE